MSANDHRWLNYTSPAFVLEDGYDMRWGFIVGIALPLLLRSVVYSDMLPFDETQLQRLSELSRFLWLDSLTSKEASFVDSSLRAERPEIVQSALEVVAVHQLNQLLPTMRQITVDSAQHSAKLYSVALSRIVTNGLIGPERISDVLRSYLTEQLPGDENKHAKSYVRASAHIRGRINSILVVREARALRKDEISDPDTSNLDMTNYHVELLKYSAMPSKVAVDSIIHTLSRAEVMGAQESDLIAVLRTYSGYSVNTGLELLSSAIEGSEFTLYGKIALLQTMIPHVNDMDERQLLRLRNLLSVMKAGAQDQPLAVTVSGVEALVEERLKEQEGQR